MENRKQIDLLIGDLDVIPVDAVEKMRDEQIHPYSRLRLARKWIEASSKELRRRKAELAQVQKKIIIDKSDKQLYMLEDGREVYSMPVSLGRNGWNTRTGEFEILDKLGTIWSYWDIWLPRWMGIYFAGSSENGIHGLPYDNMGNVYWEDSIGKYNVTYGCVMPKDEDMVKLYGWAEVGTPVSIVR